MKGEERIEYKSKNGYSGSLYGKSSMRIYDRNGMEVLHTGFRTVNTIEELKEIVDTMPEFMDAIRREMENQAIHKFKEDET